MSAPHAHRLLMSMAVVCVTCAGCFDATPPDSKQPAAGKTEPSRATTAPRQPAAGQQPPTRNVAANPHRAANPQQSDPPPKPGTKHRSTTTLPGYPSPANAEYIHLSAGAALPQTLPQGETMTFSAEYRFTGGPKDGVRYAFVAQGRGGKAIRIALPNLKTQGQLPAVFTREFRSTDGPFRGYIEEWPASSGRPRPGDGKRVSNIVPLS